MELLEFLKSIPLPVVLTLLVIAVVVTLFIGIQYIKQMGLSGLRTEVYRLILVAEHMYRESGQGRQKMKWVVQQARLLLPPWMKLFVTEYALEKIIESWFKAIKDLLDDGKLNKSQNAEENNDDELAFPEFDDNKEEKEIPETESDSE